MHTYPHIWVRYLGVLLYTWIGLWGYFGGRFCFSNLHLHCCHCCFHCWMTFHPSFPMSVTLDFDCALSERVWLPSGHERSYFKHMSNCSCLIRNLINRKTFIRWRNALLYFAWFLQSPLSLTLSPNWKKLNQCWVNILATIFFCEHFDV